jgi:hypothetical protein
MAENPFERPPDMNTHCMRHIIALVLDPGTKRTPSEDNAVQNLCTSHEELLIGGTSFTAHCAVHGCAVSVQMRDQLGRRWEAAVMHPPTCERLQ